MLLSNTVNVKEKKMNAKLYKTQKRSTKMVNVMILREGIPVMASLV